MPPPIVHIGVHKTASSWFQSVLYPQLTSHRYVDRVTVRRALLGGTAFEFDAVAARATLGADLPGAPPLLCDEDLSGFLHNGGLTAAYVAKEVAHRIRAVLPQAHIVIFVREQAALAAACYQQYVREGGTSGARRYLFPADYRHLTKERPFKTPRFEVSQFAHDALVAHYDALFGRDRVHVFAYEAFAANRAPFLADYAARLGLRHAPLADARPVNASYGRALIPLARALNLFTARSVADKRVLVHLPYWYPVRKRLLEALNGTGAFGRPPDAADLFGADAVAWLRDRFAASNARLAVRMGVDLAALGYALDPAVVPLPRPRRPALLRALAN